MPSKKECCRNWKLYVITDAKLVTGGQTLEDVVRQAIAGGADVIQLRDKNVSDGELCVIARKLLFITRPAHVPLIVNDRANVAKKVGADGVHLGQEDGCYLDARTLLGDEAIIGRSTHSREQAKHAEREGFDYIGVGPVFPTPTKPNYSAVGLHLVRYAKDNIHIPFVAIGGIDASNIQTVVDAGARTIAVLRAVFGSEHPTESARKLKKCLGC